MYIEFNNASRDLIRVIELKDGRTREIGNQINEVSLEFSKRRDRLQFHEKLVRGFHQTLCQFKGTMDDVDEWCKKEKKEIGKVDLKDKKTAKAEITRIDVSSIFVFVLLEEYKLCCRHDHKRRIGMLLVIGSDC